MLKNLKKNHLYNTIKRTDTMVRNGRTLWYGRTQWYETGGHYGMGGHNATERADTILWADTMQQSHNIHSLRQKTSPNVIICPISNPVAF